MRTQETLYYVDCLASGNAVRDSKEEFLQEHNRFHRENGEDCDNPVVFTQAEFDEALKEVNGDALALYNKMRAQYIAQNSPELLKKLRRY